MEAAFKAYLSEALGVDESQIFVYNSEPGSVRVLVLVLPPLGSREMPQSEVDRIIAAAEQLQFSQFGTAGPVVLQDHRLPQEVAPESNIDSKLLGLGLVPWIAINAAGGALLLLVALLILCAWRTGWLGRRQGVDPADPPPGPLAEGTREDAALLPSAGAAAVAEGAEPPAVPGGTPKADKVHPEPDSPSAGGSSRSVSSPDPPGAIPSGEGQEQPSPRMPSQLK